MRSLEEELLVSTPKGAAIKLFVLRVKPRRLSNNLKELPEVGLLKLIMPCVVAGGRSQTHARA